MRLEGTLITAYRRMHRIGTYGDRSFVSRYTDRIAAIVAEIPTSTMLDYGCGNGAAYTKHRIHDGWGGIMPVLFDPAVPGLDELPRQTFDGVLCIGVLEHIPKAEIGLAIDNLVAYADRWCFCVVGTDPAHKTLPGGRNAHVLLRPREWWRTHLGAAFEASGCARLYLDFVPA